MMTRLFHQAVRVVGYGSLGLVIGLVAAFVLYLDSRPDLKVLLMSGYTGLEQWNTIVASNYPFLQKPFTATALCRKVREVLDQG